MTKIRKLAVIAAASLIGLSALSTTMPAHAEQVSINEYAPFDTQVTGSTRSFARAMELVKTESAKPGWSWDD